MSRNSKLALLVLLLVASLLAVIGLLGGAVPQATSAGGRAAEEPETRAVAPAALVEPPSPAPEPETAEEPAAREPERSAVQRSGEATRKAPATPKDEPDPPPRLARREFRLQLRFAPRTAEERANDDSTEASTELELVHTQSIDVRDVIFGPDRYARFERRYEGSWNSQSAVHWTRGPRGSQRVGDLRAVGRSPLDGRRLSFVFDGVAGEWDVEPVRRKRDDPADLVDDLRPDLDLRALAPKRVPFVGEQWLVEDADLRDLFQPGGDLHVEFEQVRRSWGALFTMEDLEDALTDFRAPDGDLLLTATGLVPERGPQREGFDASLEVAFTCEKELPDPYSGPGETSTFVHRLEFSGEGTGSWNAQGGYVDELKIAGEVVLTRLMKRTGADVHEGRFPGMFTLSVRNEVQPVTQEQLLHEQARYELRRAGRK